ncbi:DUF805 domain-containing protein [Myroides marinus]|uniref:Uncharacterized protein n=1 Tax=Myroides marinus TaxID=703342 RepID=A0A161S9N8_9FLAO|nr:DUF805 domain-containing protein [Myroides marinus]KZE82254.1 hypothetical protein AV926_07285 [Myroides marinus]MDM1350217.1 DUF805 domain-containing protein [Myroides marinus]MDM1357424.1 DUF805 domain-containing protein [Myroides marinus]MDM1364789.1 DUF805 domain-containing protein [Myroides marinus]MDM1370007.1 DUF805 domain-containing protein [Myroides marinus]
MIKEALSYKGTINRRAYIVSLITYFVLLFLVLFIFSRLSGVFFAILFLIVFSGLHVFLFGKGTKRCRDLGKTGWDQFSIRIWLLMVSKDKKVENKVAAE